MMSDEDIIEIVLSENSDQDTNDLSERVSETQKKISFEMALTALNTITEFIEEQPDDSFVRREDIFGLQRLRRGINLKKAESLRQKALDNFVTKSS